MQGNIGYGEEEAHRPLSAISWWCDRAAPTLLGLNSSKDMNVSEAIEVLYGDEETCERRRKIAILEDVWLKVRIRI